MTLRNSTTLKHHWNHTESLTKDNHIEICLILLFKNLKLTKTYWTECYFFSVTHALSQLSVLHWLFSMIFSVTSSLWVVVSIGDKALTFFSYTQSPLPKQVMTKRKKWICCTNCSKMMTFWEFCLPEKKFWHLKFWCWTRLLWHGTLLLSTMCELYACK